jgi:hypothetical protein
MRRFNINTLSSALRIFQSPVFRNIAVYLSVSGVTTAVSSSGFLSATNRLPVTTDF